MTETPENERPNQNRNDERAEEPRARLRAQPFSWVWLFPLGAAAIVIWLAWRNLSDRGPAITISFRNVDGLQAGQTKIQHRNVDLGTVESLELTPDMTHVIVHARMTRQAKDHLTENTRFAIIAPHVGVGGISGLSTIVSGSYIEMYPGKPGEPKRDFVGLDEPPVLPPDSRGRSFTLLANDLGSLTRGSPISYKGITIGEVEDYTLRPGNKGVTVTAFIRSPHEDLVHPETRFWNAGGVDLTLGSQGLRIRANSWEQLLSGGIAFETPNEVLSKPPSAAGSVFGLYDNRRAADRAPLGPTLVYVADFTGNQRGLDTGTVVELQGIEVGEVTEAHLAYDDRAHTLVTRTTFYVDPERVEILNMPRAARLEPTRCRARVDREARRRRDARAGVFGELSHRYEAHRARNGPRRAARTPGARRRRRQDAEQFLGRSHCRSAESAKRTQKHRSRHRGSAARPRPAVTG